MAIKIGSAKLCEVTGARPWSETISQRKLRLYGHVMRPPDDTPRLNLIVIKSLLTFYIENNVSTIILFREILSEIFQVNTC